MRQIKSVSLNDEEVEFVDEMGLSITGLLKQRIQEVKETSLNFRERIKESNLKLVNQLRKACDFLEKKGLLDEYLKEQCG